MFNWDRRGDQAPDSPGAQMVLIWGQLRAAMRQQGIHREADLRRFFLAHSADIAAWAAQRDTPQDVMDRVLHAYGPTTFTCKVL